MNPDSLRGCGGLAAGSGSVGRRWLGGGLGAVLGVVAASTAGATVVQTNFGTGDKSVPGYAVSNTDLLQTALVSATRTGAPGLGDQYFYRENSGYTVYLARLSDGTFGTEGTESAFTVMPNQVTLTFTLDTVAAPQGYAVERIRTYAGWDSGRDGQAYVVEYATVDAPGTFVTLATVTRFDNTSFPLMRTSYEFDDETHEFTEVQVPDEDYSHTLVELTSVGGSLASNVAAVRFVFGGVENGGTGFREFDLIGEAMPAAIPEPARAAGLGAGFAGLAVIFRRRKRT